MRNSAPAMRKNVKQFTTSAMFSISISISMAMMLCASVVHAESGDALAGQQPAGRPLPLPDYATEGDDPAARFELPPLPPELIAEESRGPHFMLRKVIFSGTPNLKTGKLRDDEQLEEIVADYIGRQINIADLEEMRLRITRRYVDGGFVNSGARLPRQKISNGEVRFEIVEGRLTGINISGNERLDPDYLTKRLQLDENEVLDTRKLQQQFQLLLTDPLIDRLNGALRPGIAPGEAMLDLEVQRALPYRLTVAADNHHSPGSGAEELVVDGTIYNLPARVTHSRSEHPAAGEPGE